MSPKKIVKAKRRIQWHLNDAGLSNELISDFLSHFSLGQHYLGVVSWRKLSSLLNRVIHAEQLNIDPIVIIINIGEHFVCLVIESTVIRYVDSFGDDIPPEIMSFIKDLEQARGKNQKDKTIYVNKEQIQSYASSHCGLYAALFAIWFLSPPEKRIKLDFYSGTDELKLMRNDDKCQQYLTEYIRLYV